MTEYIHDFYEAALPWLTLGTATALVISVSRSAKEKDWKNEK